MYLETELGVRTWKASESKYSVRSTIRTSTVPPLQSAAGATVVARGACAGDLTGDAQKHRRFWWLMGCE